MTEPESTPAEPGPDATIDELQADIEGTRADLGDTARALTEKLDVKARAGDAIKPVIPITIAVAALVLGVVVWLRRKR